MLRMSMSLLELQIKKLQEQLVPTNRYWINRRNMRAEFYRGLSHSESEEHVERGDLRWLNGTVGLPEKRL